MPNTVPGLPDVCGRGSQWAQRCPHFEFRHVGAATVLGSLVSRNSANPTSPKTEKSLSRQLPGEKSEPRCRMRFALSGLYGKCDSVMPLRGARIIRKAGRFLGRGPAYFFIRRRQFSRALRCVQQASGGHRQAAVRGPAAVHRPYALSAKGCPAKFRLARKPVCR